jgi:hypothetical protein
MSALKRSTSLRASFVNYGSFLKMVKPLIFMNSQFDPKLIIEKLLSAGRLFKNSFRASTVQFILDPDIEPLRSTIKMYSI